MSPFTIRALQPSDRGWVGELLARSWGEARLVVHGEVFQGDQLPGFAAIVEDQVVGLVTYFMGKEDCEVISLDSLQEGRGIGRALLRAVAEKAVQQGCRVLKLTTTNDNLHALGFYQHLGFQLSALRCNAVAESRKIKPGIPLVAENGIPIRDELELVIEPLRLVE